MERPVGIIREASDGNQYQWLGAQWAKYNTKTQKASLVASKDIAKELNDMDKQKPVVPTQEAANDPKISEETVETVQKLKRNFSDKNMARMATKEMKQTPEIVKKIMGDEYKDPMAKEVKGKATKIDKLSTDDAVLDILSKILKHMQKVYDEDKLRKEEDANFAEGNADKKARKDAEMLKALEAQKGAKGNQDDKSAEKLEKETDKGPFTIIEEILNAFGGAKKAISLLTNIGKFFLTNPIGLGLIAGGSLLALLATDKHADETSKGIVNAGSADGGTAESIIATAEQTTAIERKKQNILADRPSDKKSMLFWKDGDLQTAYLKEIGWDDKTGTTKVERDGGMIGIDDSGKPIMKVKGASAEEAAKSRSDFAKKDPRLIGGGGGDSSSTPSTPSATPVSGSSGASGEDGASGLSSSGSNGAAGSSGLGSPGSSGSNGAAGASAANGASATPAAMPSATPSASQTSSPAAVPAPVDNIGQKLTEATGSNLDMKLLESTAAAVSSTVNNSVSKVANKQSSGKSPMPAVRNQEETFQRMIFHNTRVV